MNKIRFSFDWGTNDCLWDGNGPMNLANLGISPQLCTKLKTMGNEIQSALNWADPTAPFLWPQERQDDFVDRAKIAYQQLCEELGPQYNIIYCFDWFKR